MPKKIIFYFSTLLFWFVMLCFTNKIVCFFDYKRKLTFDIIFAKYSIVVYVLFFVLLGATIAIVNIISSSNSFRENIYQILILGLPGLYLSINQIVYITVTPVGNIIYPKWIIFYPQLPMILGSIVLGWEIVLLIKSIRQKIIENNRST